MSEVPQLIQCGDHNWAPWCICCTHLMFKHTNKAIGMPNPHIRGRSFNGGRCFKMRMYALHEPSFTKL
jgi:hypothetical protein